MCCEKIYSAKNIGEIIMAKKTEKKEKDLSMTDEAWNKRVGRIEEFLSHEGNQEFLNSSDDIIDAVELIQMNIRRGNRNATKRKNLWNQILIEGRDWTTEKQELLVIDWPVAVGKESNLPAHAQASLKEMKKMVQEAYAEFWNSNPIIQMTSVISDRNKQLGGSPFENGLEFGEGRGVAVNQRFVKYFTDGRWDGNFSLEDGFTIKPPLPAENAKSEEKTDEGEPDDS